MANNMIKITLVKSTIACLDKQKKTVQALGLKRSARPSFVRTTTRPAA
ncbi:MAG: uL30 family ribosomal protein [Christensenellales bacterium]